MSKTHNSANAAAARRRRKVQCATLAAALAVLLAAPFARAADPAPTAMPATTTTGGKGASCDPYKTYECLDDYLGEGFFGRLYNYYGLEWGHADVPTDPNQPEQRRPDWPAAAQSTPPMPFTEWPYGGTTPLGVTRPNSIDSPLMAALGNTSVGKWMGENNLQLYGWVDVGGNFSTSTVPHGGNSPAAYLYNPNTVQLDQIVFYLDRFPDTVQKDHIDWGLRLSAIYGENYRYTTAYGLSSNQFTLQNNVNGYDYPMVYGEVFIPQVMEGLMLRFGRYISLPDIEAQLAPNNYMYTHSMTYTYDNYTNTGIQSTLALNKNWMLQFGVSIGSETSLRHLHDQENNPYPNVPGTGPGQVGYNPLYPGKTFKVDPGTMPTYTACFRWNSDSGRDDINACANAINRGTYGYNNLQWYGFTYYHQMTEKWHFAYEFYSMHQYDVPNALNADVQTIYANGGAPFSSHFIAFNAPSLAVCADASQLKCTSRSYGTVAYFNYQPDPLNNFSIRPELYWDPQGQRTGTPTHYANFGLGWQHWFSPQVEVRPEIGYWHSFDAPAFNGNGNAGIAPDKKSEVILSGDVIWHY